MTVFMTKGDGKVDKFSLTCSNCSDTSRREDKPNSIKTRYTNLVPYTIYSFKATAIAGTESNHRKESSIASIDCKTSEGRKYLFCFIVMNMFHVVVSSNTLFACVMYNQQPVRTYFKIIPHICCCHLLLCLLPQIIG